MLRFKSTKKNQKVRSRFRNEGDKARDRQDWANAIIHYRNHLLLSPEDVDIWIQLGHMLKQDGQTSDALATYRRAWELTPNNADLLLHLGHALHISGDVDNGVARLRESAIAGNMQATQDLEHLGISIVPQQDTSSLADRDKPSKQLLDALSLNTTPLRAVDCSDIKLSANGHLKTLSNDPWIIFEWEDGARPQAPLALLTIETETLNDLDPIPQLYADNGEGFSERHSTRFSITSNKSHIILINPSIINKIRFDPDQKINKFSIPKMSVIPLDNIKDVENLIRNNNEVDDIDWIIDLIKDIYSSLNQESRPKSPVLALQLDGTIDFSQDYDYWLAKNATPRKKDYDRMKDIQSSFTIRPFFSFVMPTYNTPIELLRECMEAMLGQTYQNFEICIADDNSPDPAVAEMLDDYANKYSNVKFTRRKNNGHISAATNTALSTATGDFIVLIDHDDKIPDFTLFIAAYYINKHPEADILFSDEDKITSDGNRLHPYFKSDFNKFLMYGHNMVSHLGIYRRSLVEKVGGFRLGLEGSQDYDLLLRCFEQTSRERIIHIPHVLYHWRIIPGSTAMSADQKNYAVVAAHNAINGHFERLQIPLRSVEGFAPGCTSVRPSKEFDTPVSIIIPTRNGLDLLRPCVESILARDHSNVEIIIVDNGSDDPETIAYLDTLKDSDLFQIIKDPDPFNFSRINNLAAARASGDILCFLNNDTEVISKDWLNRARTFLSMAEVGMVGARLLFPDGTLQHFGIALGMGDHRIAGVPHLNIDGNLPGYFGKARLLQEVSAVTAACMFVRKSDFNAVGGFEEALRVAYNDIDLCLKIRALDKVILADPEMLLTHKESRTRGSDKSGQRAERLAEEAQWMRDNWAQQLDRDPYYSPNIDLKRVDFAYAAKPRQPWPWEDDPA